MDATGELSHAVQILDLRSDAQLVQIQAERVQAVDHARHILFVVNVRRLWQEDLQASHHVGLVLRLETKEKGKMKNALTLGRPTCSMALNH